VTRHTEHLSPDLDAYLSAHSAPPDPVLAELADETAARFPAEASLQIGPVQGTFMTLVARLVGARNGVEVGTFTGYSAICLARGLAEGGRLLCCDISEEWTAVARSFWEKADVADRIELRLGPALGTLRALPEDETFDVAFIDADKAGYIGYWEEIVPRARSGAVILVDNTLSHGRVAAESAQPAGVQAIRDFNDHAAADSRVELALLPIGDGLTLARKK
jgi:caffeoyl-CoA O-methyltransferase